MSLIRSLYINTSLLQSQTHAHIHSFPKPLTLSAKKSSESPVPFSFSDGYGCFFLCNDIFTRTNSFSTKQYFQRIRIQRIWKQLLLQKLGKHSTLSGTLILWIAQIKLNQIASNWTQLNSTYIFNYSIKTLKKKSRQSAYWNSFE